MPKITAIVHTSNDALRIGRALDSLRCCDEVLVIDHDSTDETIKEAKKHGASVKKGLPGVEPGAYVMDARHDWILCVHANEALSESLEASIHEFKDRNDEEENSGNSPIAFNLTIREEHGKGWQSQAPETRLANRSKVNWTTSECPPQMKDVPSLPGELMRFEEPPAAKTA
jgi:glycosyltransferase involved in cell wall biosynthesis